MSSLLYLYGFVPSAAALPAAGLAGVADEPVELLDCDGFAAAVGRVASADFTPDALEARTRDVAWVGAHGVAHEAVVAWFVDHSEILPVPLFTLYSSDAALFADAAARRQEVLATLAEFRGLREWDLKVAFAEAELRAHAAELSGEVAELERRLAEATPGTRFLLERKRDEVVRTQMRSVAHRLADELLELATPCTRRVRRLPLGQAAGESVVVLNAALLVAGADEGALRERLAARAAELAPLGLLISFSGPWAPYRFLAPEESLA